MRVLITAGPTREPLDEVRYLSNRSSGRLGIALAEAAAHAGHETTLLLGPGIVAPVASQGWGGLSVERFTSAGSLEGLLGQRFPECDVLIMAAAVADYRPAAYTEGKLKRREDETLVLELEPIPDLVAGCGASKREGQKVIAFALDDPTNLDEQAAEKMRRKHADAIVANPLGTMDGADIDATLVLASGERFTPGPLSKEAFAVWLIGQLEQV
ncbi:MAG: phosphopantothenoylcysteine decarboxylase [Planctomycetota bacterium]